MTLKMIILNKKSILCIIYELTKIGQNDNNLKNK